MTILSSLNLGPADWALALLCALLVGFTKTGVTGMGMLIIPIMAMIFPPSQSPGVLLPMLIMGDVMAVGYYHRHAVWSHLLRLLPWAVAGIIAAFLLLKFNPMSERAFARMLGGIMLGCILSVTAWKRTPGAETGDEPSSKAGRRMFAAFMGILGGIATMIANAAGSIWSVYLLAVGLPKYAFVGTGAWFYLILNSFKVPFQVNLGNITAATVAFNFMMLPLIVVGGVLGILILPRINQALFNRLIILFAGLAGLRLLLG
jgi:uncharacterized membrane protein YfcA